MAFNSRQIHDEYLSWLSGEIYVEEYGEAYEMTMPFLDSRNDHLQIYVVPNGDGYVLTDGGRTIQELRSSGVHLNTPKRKLLASQILNSVSATTDDDRIAVKATRDDFGQRVQFLVKAILGLGDMFMLAQPTVEAVFKEDVQRMLEENAVEYESRVEFEGRSGYRHQVDFVIPASNGAPTRLVEAIDTPSRDNVNNFLWTLSDTEYSRPEQMKPYAFLNDRRSEIGDDLFEALTSYSVVAVPWSERLGVVEELRA